MSVIWTSRFSVDVCWEIKDHTCVATWLQSVRRPSARSSRPLRITTLPSKSFRRITSRLFLRENSLPRMLQTTYHYPQPLRTRPYLLKSLCMINNNRLQITSFTMFTKFNTITCFVFLVVVIVILATICSFSLFASVLGITMTSCSVESSHS